MGVASFTPLTLTGVSTYSSDLQSILSRAVQIGQLPITALQNKDADLLSRGNLLGSLSNSVAALASSLKNLGTVGANRGLAATSSDATKITVSNSGATAPTSYVINSITSPASAAQERSLVSYGDSASTPVSTTGSMKLMVGATPYSFTLDSNNLVTLRDKINTLGAGVTASILTTSGGNYLSLSANATGATPLQLIDDPGDVAAGHTNTAWLTNTNPGTNAAFQLNGIDISQSGNVVNNVIPGVNFTIVSASATPVTLTLASDRTQLSSGLQDLVSNYNAVRTQLNAQEGPAAGQLSGDTAVTQAESMLRQIANYTTTGASGQITSLASLGVEFDTSGQMSFTSTTSKSNQIAFDTLTDTQISDGFKFLGSATTGLGALAASAQQLSDPIGGLMKIEQQGLATTDKNIQDQIATLTDRLSLMQTGLAAKLQVADSLLAQLQSQQSMLTSDIQSLNLVSYGKNPSS